MRDKLNCIRKTVWKPLKTWVNRIVKGRDDDDDPYNHPYVIF
jgi:hypothetical protein